MLVNPSVFYKELSLSMLLNVFSDHDALTVLWLVHMQQKGIMCET